MPEKKDYTDYVFTTKQGYEVKVLKELENSYWECVFLDSYNHKTKIRDYTIRTKGLKNPFHPTC